MANDFQWLLAMHETASCFGDGLKPELEALLRSDLATHGPDVRALNQRQISSGPAEQSARQEDLTAAGIPSIAPGTRLRTALVEAREIGGSTPRNGAPQSSRG